MVQIYPGPEAYRSSDHQTTGQVMLSEAFIGGLLIVAGLAISIHSWDAVRAGDNAAVGLCIIGVVVSVLGIGIILINHYL